MMILGVSGGMVIHISSRLIVAALVLLIIFLGASISPASDLVAGSPSHILLMLAPAAFSQAADAGYDNINYSRAEGFIPANVIPTLYNMSVVPNWIDGTKSFWYMEAGRSGNAFLIVDILNRTRLPAFNHSALAAALAKASGEHVVASDLPFSEISFADGRLRFFALNRSWEYDPGSSAVHEVPPGGEASPGETLSPDGTLAAFVQDHNLWIRNVSTGDKYPVTSDGFGDYAFAERSQTVSYPVTRARLNETPEPYAVWSPDSRRIATFRMDQRNVTPLYLLQYVPGNDSRPRNWTYRFAMPDNDWIPMYEPIAVDIQERRVIPVSCEAQPEVSLMDTDQDVLQWWSDDGRTLYSLFAQRGERSLRLLEINPENGSARELLKENGSTYVEANLDYASAPNAKVLKNGDVIWFSERSGYGHLYLYGKDGKQKNPITSGDWVVRELIYVDENNSTVYFTAGGKEPGRDPYYRQLYSVNLSGAGLRRLTPEDADHSISMAPDGTAFIDTYSRVDMPPVTVLRDRKGNVTLTIETGDIGNLTAMNWVPPERFMVKALDGKTSLYGLIFKPTDFNASRKYPVVETVYPGPWIIVTSKAFPGEMIWVDKIFWRAQALSELGFLVVTIDGPGTPYRPKAFHDASYGHLGNAGGLADHVNALKELAADRPYMDLSRVGMFGHSAGGFMTAQALLTYPDFYKVGLASSGDYDSRFYGAYWGEKYEGLGANYTEQVTALKADRLQGKLLLVAGDVDDNVNPCMTMQMVDAFIKADKPFDLLIMPNRNHDLSYDDYYLHRLFGYFAQNLR